MAVVAPFKVGDVIRRRTKAGTYERVERLFRVVFINTKGINGGVFQAEPADDTGTSWWAGPTSPSIRTEDA